MKTLTIIAAQNIRMDRDVVMGEVLAEIRTDHPLLTIMQMVRLGQATVRAAEHQAALPQVITAPRQPGKTLSGFEAAPGIAAPGIVPNPDGTDEPQTTSGSPRPASGRGAGGEGPTEQPPTVQPAPSDASIVLARPLTDFPKLDAKLRDHLAAAEPPITTLREATQYLADNGGHFRALAGIGTVGDKQIKAALGL